jgi:hypothetical protein
MKNRVTSLLLGICLAVSVIAASPAYARTTTAFTSFRLRLPIDSTQNPYNCITESYGAVVNNCAYQVSVSFDLIIDHPIVHTVKAQNYVSGTGTIGTSCAVWSYDGNGSGRASPILGFKPNGEQTLTFSSILFGDTISLLCDSPSGEGVSSITWNP